MTDKKTTPKFKTQFNAHLFTETGEKNTMPSKTVPEMGLTVAQIVERMKRGLPAPGARVPVFSESEDLLPEDFAKWDLADQEAYMGENAARIEQMQENIAAIEAEQRKKALEMADELAKYKAAAAAINNPPKPDEK